MRVRNLGVGAIAVGVIVLIYNFFHMYSLPATCTNGLPCHAYTVWRSTNWIGIGVIGVGVVIAGLGLVRRK